MGSEWKRMLLGDFINLKRGFDLPTTTRTNGECLVYSSSGISGAHNIHICEPPGVITGRYGTIGQVFYAPKPYWPLNTTLYVEDFKGNEPKFVYYYLKTIPWQQFTQKSAVPGVNRNDVHRLEVTIPPVLIQHSIAATLSALDDKIELNNRIIANLEAQAQAIFKSWFVDFEPFQDGEFEESELGLIPKGWKKFTFSEILTPKTEKDNSPDIPEYSVTNTGIFTREEKYKKKLSMTNSANKIIRRGDLVFGMSRTILNWGIMNDEIGGVSSAYHVFKVDECVSPKYLDGFMRSYISYFGDIIKPAAREGQGIDKSALYAKLIYLPCEQVISDYYSIEDALTTSIESYKQQNVSLEQIRDTLLPKLMSGEIELPVEG